MNGCRSALACWLCVCTTLTVESQMQGMVRLGVGMLDAGFGSMRRVFNC
jgi:hypothetical protein